MVTGRGLGRIGVGGRGAMKEGVVGDRPGRTGEAYLMRGAPGGHGGDGEAGNRGGGRVARRRGMQLT